jgi:two-component system OmpR family sensor kinase
VSTSNGMTTIEIADNGPGLPAAELDRIFDRFHRSDEGRTRRGSGLGLAIVSSVVATHGGSVSVDSTEGEGCTFMIELPAR